MTTAAGSLADVTVVDLTGSVAGALSTLQLADAGAAVTKVEPLVGDPLRSFGPEADGARALHLMVNRDKRSIALHLHSAEAKPLLDRLVTQAGVVVVDHHFPNLIDYEKLAETNQGLVFCSISPWGESGPYSGNPATDLEIQGMTGHMWFLGEVGSPPVRVGADIAEVAGGMHAFTGIIGALLWRMDSGRGQRVDVSLAGSLLSLGSHWMADFSNPDSYTGGVIHPYEVPETGYKAKDGQVIFGFYGQREDRREHWQALCRRLDLGELLKDPWVAEHGAGYVGVGKDAQEMKPVLEGALKDWTSHDFVDMMNDVGARVAPFLTYEELYREPPHPETEANGVFISIEDEAGEPQRVILSPWATTPGISRSEHHPAPRLGADTDEVLEQAGVAKDEIRDLRAAGLIA